MPRLWLVTLTLVAAVGCSRQPAGPPPFLGPEPRGAPVPGGGAWQPPEMDPAPGPLTAARNIQSVAASPDGRWLACGEQAGPHGAVVRLFDRATGRQRAVLTGHEHAPTHLAFSPDSARLYSGLLPPDWGSHSGHLSVWELASGAEVARLPCHTFAVSPDGRTVTTVESVNVPTEITKGRMVAGED